MLGATMGKEPMPYLLVSFSFLATAIITNE